MKCPESILQSQKLNEWEISKSFLLNPVFQKISGPKQSNLKLKLSTMQS